MAFLDCRDAALHALPAGPSTAEILQNPDAALAARLTPHELRIVDLARGDGLHTLREQRKRGWFARLILGPQPPSPKLANERLEALRQLSVHAWHKGYLLPISAQKAAQAAGFSEDLVGAVVDAIERVRSAQRYAPA